MDDLATALYIFQALLIAGVCAFLEHPRYADWLRRKDPASMWMIPAVVRFEEHEAVETVTFDQCVLGQDASKGTTLLLLRAEGIAKRIRAKRKTQHVQPEERPMRP